jgi:RNA polymerase sigma factor (sigma-70 family)
VIADDATLSHLAGLAQRGDKQAYAALLGAAQQWLQRYFRRRTTPCQLDDLVQETLLSVHRKLASYEASRPFTPWLAAIARYRYVDHLRLVYRRAEDELSADFADTASDEPEITARISLERLFEALPDAQQRAIELVKIEGFTIAEASQSTGQSESLVKVNIHRGLKRLAALIERG